jgi:hypothetical protein
MIFAAKNQEARADRRDDAERASRVYVEPSPCVVIPAVDLSALISKRFSAPRTIYEYLT